MSQLDEKTQKAAQDHAHAEQLAESILLVTDGDVTPLGDYWDNRTALFDGDDMIFVYKHENDSDIADETFTVEIRVYKGEYDR